MKNVYFERYAWKDRLFPDFQPSPDLELAVVIPCHNEPDISLALKSLNQCALDREFLVIVVVNESTEADERISDQNAKTLIEINQLEPDLRFPVLTSHQRFPEKKAGVGLARKVGMDEAAWFFEQITKDGIIVCYDADCTCETNYLQSILEFYDQSKMECGIVHYEHRMENNREAIVNYELFLRYYIDVLRWAGFPYAFQTLGSCITVKSRRYQKEGGMNTRKAGEDFYFLHKVIPNGRFGEINSTCIHPSDRVSDRVPFGTGHAIDKYIQSGEDSYMTYSPNTFEDLKAFISDPTPQMSFSKLPPGIQSFLEAQVFDQALQKMIKESTDHPSFRRKFFEWMDAFRILKFVHFSRDHFYPNVSIDFALQWLNETYYRFEMPEDHLRKLAVIRCQNALSDDYPISKTK